MVCWLQEASEVENDLDRIRQGDCITLLGNLPAGKVDLVFADPPFNIGYEYDHYDDCRTREEYLDWSRRWMSGIARALKPTGTFWLAIGDEYAAELKLMAQDQLGFTCRSWVIWYYTFGVNCVRGFSRSHTHLLHFVKDPAHFTFNAENPSVRVLSARQLVYADARANPKGRLPDNTWILRPQDAPAASFAPMHDTWYFARVAGTFREREGYHGCQMPEQLLGRIIRVSSSPGELVLDPFVGSGTTAVTAKKLGRRWLGYECSPEYARRARERVAMASVGEPLDGPKDPLRSAPATARGKSKLRLRNGRPLPVCDDETERAITHAYQSTSNGYSADYLLCDRELNHEFVSACKRSGIPGSPYVWNRLLLRIRKRGKLPKAWRSQRQISFETLDSCSFGSEIAMHLLSVDYDMELEDLLCHPSFAREFDRGAARFAPGHSSFAYRWAALTIRKRSPKSRLLAKERFARWRTRKLPESRPLSDYASDEFARPGVYIASATKDSLYVGETTNLRDRITQMLHCDSWMDLNCGVLAFVPQTDYKRQHGLQSMLIHRTNPLLNSRLLQPKLDGRRGASQGG